MGGKLAGIDISQAAVKSTFAHTATASNFNLPSIKIQDVVFNTRSATIGSGKPVIGDGSQYGPPPKIGGGGQDAAFAYRQSTVDDYSARGSGRTTGGAAPGGNNLIWWLLGGGLLIFILKKYKHGLRV